MNPFSFNFKLGILGGGQLGKMLLTETQKLNIQTFILENSKESPCFKISKNFILGDWKDFNTVYQFGKDKDVLTVEIEHINIDALEKLSKEGVKVYPQPSVLKIIQNKGTQKDFFKLNAIPTASYKRFKNKNELLQAKIEYPCIWKADTLGYDGSGVKKLHSKSDLLSLNDVPCILEEVIPFKKELAVIVARNEFGEIKTFPTVEMEFNPENNQVEFVISPAEISEKLNNKAQEIAIKTSNSFNHIGLLAVELFLTEKDTILVNEVAPRPHNSGHYSIEASYTNQFEQHLRAILNLPLGNTLNKLPAVMYNLSGDKDCKGIVHYSNILEVLKIQGATIHLYGKKEVKPNRKMGHITVVNKNIVEAKRLAVKIKNTIKVCNE